MVEVISLLSSPLKSPRPQTRRTDSIYVARTEKLFTLHSDDFESTGNLSFAVANSSKKRKLNDASTSRTRTSSRATSLQPAFDDVLPIPASIITKQFKVTKSTDFDFSDPITFSSSAPQPGTTQKSIKAFVHDLSDDLPDDIFGHFLPSASQPLSISTADRPLRERTANLLAQLSRETSSSGKASTGEALVKKPNQFRMMGAKAAGASAIDDIFSSSPPKAAAARGRKPKSSEAGKNAQAEGRAQARAELKASKDAEKEIGKERKRLEKEERAREKRKADDIAEVNKKKTNKKVTTKEMMLDMSRGLQGTGAGDQIEEYMKELEVEIKYFDEEIDLSSTDDSAPIYPGNIVKWRRLVQAQYNEGEGHWERIPISRIEQAKHVLIHLTAAEFAALVAQPPSSNTPTPVSEIIMKSNLDKHITYIHSLVQESKPIYLIEGLDTWLRKNAAAKNRAYTAAVLAQDTPSSQAPPSSQTARSRKRKKPPPSILDLSHFDAPLIERLHLHLQLHSLRPSIHLTTSPSTASWIRSFTSHISTIPYRRLQLSTNLSSASFCMASGQVKTGENAQDTYVRMLQEVQRVTPSMAYGIAGRYADVRQLVAGFKREGPLMLEDVRKSANRDGALSERRLGPQVSRRLCKVFLGREEGSVDGIA